MFEPSLVVLLLYYIMPARVLAFLVGYLFVSIMLVVHKKSVVHKNSNVLLFFYELYTVQVNRSSFVLRIFESLFHDYFLS